MRVSIDSAGRLIVPKALRDDLGFVDGVELEQGPYGLRFAADTSDHITTEQVRDIMERGRR